MKKNKSQTYILLTIILSGTVIGLIFPPVRSNYAVILFLLPLIHALYTDPERSVRYSFFFGLSLTASSCWWIFSNSGADALWIQIISGFGLFLVSASYYALFGLTYKYSHRLFGKRAIWTLPLLWGGIETAMLFEELAFPWTYLAHTFTDKIYFIQIAELFGVSSVSVAILYISLLIYSSIKYMIKRDYFRVYTRFQAALLLFFGIMIFGWLRMGYIERQIVTSGSIKASLIHPGLDVEYKWEKKNFKDIIDTQIKLSETAVLQKPDLVIWGESNFPGYLENYPSYLADFMLFAADKKVDLCIGSLGYDYFSDTDSFKKYNSTFLFDQEKNTSRYDKRKLVPFGESFPFAWALTFLKNISLGQANFDKGVNNKPFEMTGGSKFHSNICYEALFPYYNASLVRKGSQFIVNVSNDAWYENTRQVYQHSRFNVFRAIENRRSIVRLANKAENSVFLPSGRQSILFYNERNVQNTVNVPLNDSITFFTRYGRYLALLLLLFNGAVLSAGILKRKNFNGNL
ncbi:MAG: apolipoprotein N-acyltransferase [Candidatus Delongbacteria bacterium]|nr:apolipoprotein N-acyltransferase [Candidatus Delongbacteria bacterium]